MPFRLNKDKLGTNFTKWPKLGKSLTDITIWVTRLKIDAKNSRVLTISPQIAPLNIFNNIHWESFGWFWIVYGDFE